MRSILFFVLAVGLGGGIFAQEVSLFVKEVNENRSTDASDSKLELSVSVMGVTVDGTHQVKIGAITSATDDTGAVLPRMEGDFFDDQYESEAEVKITLRAPSRKATKLTSVTGHLLYLNPTEANNGLVYTKNPTGQLGKNLLAGKYDDIKVTFATRELMEKIKADNEAETKKKMDKLRESGELGEGVAQALGGLSSMLESFGGMFGFGGGSQLYFYVEGDADRLLEINVKDAAGKKINRGFSSVNDLKSVTVKEELQDDWVIELIIENEQSILKLPFTLTDVILP